MESNAGFLVSWIFGVILVSWFSLSVSGNTYPNPWTDYRKCRLEYPGYVCDPDELVDDADLNDLNNYIDDYFQGTGLETGTFCPNEEEGAVVSVAIVYDVRDALGSEGDGLTNEQMYERFAEKLRQDLSPFGQCRNNVYVIFGRKPGYRTCDVLICKNNYFFFSSSVSGDGLSTDVITSNLEFPRWVAFEMSTQFVNNMSAEETEQFQEDMRAFSQPLVTAITDTLKEIQPTLVDMLTETLSDFVSVDTEVDFKVDFSWSIGFTRPLVPSASLHLIVLLMIIHTSRQKL